MVINNYQQYKVRFDRDWARIDRGEILFYTGLVLWLAQFYISRTIFNELFGDKMLTIVRYLCMLIFFVKIVLSETSLHKRAAAVFLTAAAVFVVVQQNIHTGMPLIQVLLLVYGAKGISFRRICTVSLCTCGVLWIIPVLTDWLGVYELERSVIKTRVREYLNFVFVAYSPIYFLNIVFCTFYVFTEPERRGKNGGFVQRKTVPWPVIALMAVMSFYLYKATDTSLPYSICMLFIVLYILMVKLRIPVIGNNRFGRILAAVTFPLTALITIIAALSYDPKSKLMTGIDAFSHNRLRLSSEGLKQYGVHLLGKQIVENTDNTKGRYFYLDSAYMKDLIYFGLIVFVLILVFYSVMFYASVLENDRTLAAWLFCIALYSMFNNLLTSPAENAALFGIWYALDLLKWHRKKGKIKRLNKRKSLEHAA